MSIIKIYVIRAIVDYAALKVFLAVVREEGFSRASEKIGRTQPAVSLAIRRIEEELEETLIDRSARGLHLTDAGQVVYEYGRRFENLEAEMQRSLQDLREMGAGRLSIGANESSTLYLLRPVQQFRRRYPRVAVRLIRSRSSEIPQQISNGDLEMGVISYQPNFPDLVADTIFEDHLAFIVSPQHRLAGQESVSIADLGNEQFIAHNVVSPFRRVVIQRFQDFQVPLNMDVEVPTVEAIRRLVQQNEGVAFLPRMTVDYEIRQGTLCEVQVQEISLERQIRLVYSNRRSLSRAASAFLEMVT